MAKPYRGPLSTSLRKRIEDKGGAQRYPFREVCERYGMMRAFGDFWQSSDDSPDYLQLSNRFWAKLALNLLLDFVPAFRSRKRKLGKKDVADIDAWIAAGGSFDNCPNDLTQFHQALFVKAICEIASEKNQSQRWVFEWLHNKREVTGPKGAAERLARLPRHVRHYRSCGSLREAFYSIPRAVRKAHQNYLPGPSDTSELRGRRLRSGQGFPG
jgi:hypothetical protein